MIRTFDPAPFNRIANDPDVKEWVGGEPDSVLDFTSLVLNINNVCLLTEDENGGYILENIGNGHYIAHTLALKTARGKPMASLLIEGFHYLFIATDCRQVSTSVPDGNVAAKRWAEFAGFREVYRREQCFSLHGKMVGESFMTLTWLDWVSKAPKVKAAGEEFHAFVEGIEAHPNHPEDDIHDRVAGATLLACREGNTAKAIALYNDWAKLARYLPVTILSLFPPTLNMGETVIQLYDRSLRVIRTPQIIRSSVCPQELPQE
jgi:hypothetical protein